MRKILATCAAALLAACSGHGNTPLPTGAHTTSTAIAVPAGWAATSTQGATVANATDTGALAASTPLTIRVGLQLRNATQLQQLVASGQTLSPGAFASQYAPTSDQVASVVSYLQSQGFTNITVEPNNMLISADGTAATAQKAFNTSLESFSLGGAAVYANVTPALVPQSLGGVVLAVLGLNNAAKMAVKPQAGGCLLGSKLPNGSPCVRIAYDAKTMRTAYDTGTTPTGSQTTIAVMAEGDVSQVVNDLRLAEAKNALPQVPVTIKQVGLHSPDTSGVVEWDLDTQSSTGIAENVKTLYIYATTGLIDSDIALEYNHWVTDNVAKLGNSSFGECEYQAYLDGSMLVDDQIMLQGASQGQTMFASTGDTGASCALLPTNGVPLSGAPMVEYPAASPYIVAVGGTTLFTANDGTYQGESAWNAGGGGLSQFEYSPYWESGVQPVNGAGAVSFRGMPDIAMDADILSAFFVWYGGTANAVGGTSLASPLAMGSYARLLSAHPALGFAAPRFYAVYNQNPTAGPLQTGPPPTQMIGGFHDVLSGTNGVYTAAPRYDYTTGMGSIDITAMSGAIGH